MMNLLPAAFDTLTLGRWQFGILTVYHFLQVPLTIGLSLLVAIMQTCWYRTKNEAWLQATRFFGKLMLINFALGIATGIVQEVQFGMNWSQYSVYVGNIFGAPLAVEALLAFFLESTFLGLWIFGWGRLSKGMHLATIWLTAIGTAVSALWILGANAWMQHPTGAFFNPQSGRAELDGIGGFFQVIANPILLWEYTHVIASSWLVAGTFVAGLAIWWMTRAAREGGELGQAEAQRVWRPISRFGLLVVIISGILTIITGHFQGQELASSQPMKMAVAEGVCTSQKGAAFTVAQFGDCPIDGSGEPTRFIQIPGVASLMSHNDPNAEITGVQNAHNELVQLLNANKDWTDKYGDAAQFDFVPPQMPTFWSFRIMIGLGIFSVILAVWGLVAMRKNQVPSSKSLGKFALISIPMPFISASFGWIFTEIGRQPWVVHPNLDGLRAGEPIGSVFQPTQFGVSTVVSPYEVLISLVLFAVLYAVLGVIWILLMKRYAQEGVHSTTVNKPDTEDMPVGALSFGY